MNSTTVRGRLTLWYATALALILLLFSGGTYLFVRASLYRHLDREVLQHGVTIATILRLSNDDRKEELEEQKLFESHVLFQVKDGARLFDESDGWRQLGLDTYLNSGFTAEPRSVRARTGHAYRLWFGPLAVDGHRFQVAVAVDEQGTNLLLGILTSILLVGIPVALALAVVGGYVLAGRVLAPVTSLTAAAREITADRLAERLPVTNPHDEFGRLATVFNETFARLEDSFERMRRFTADASHELRTPLTALRSVGEVCLQQAGDAAACREVIASMLEETDRLTRLVDSLLTLSRADAGLAVAERVHRDLGVLAGEVLECLQVLAEEKKQVITLDAPEPVVACIDPTTVRQALINLVDNAIKYTPAGGSIRIAVSRLHDGAAAVAVQDSGPGISAAHQRMIFDRFYRVDKGRTRTLGGAGLGLAIARWAIEFNGGTIQVESTEGQGSTFTVVVPVSEGAMTCKP